MITFLGRDFYSRVWDSFFDRDTNLYYLQVDMEDGEQWVGEVAEASSSFEEREVLLSHPAKITPDGPVRSQAVAMLVDISRVKRYYLIPRNGEDFGN